MLESSSFDFRNRYPQKTLIKLARVCGLDAETTGKTAFNISRDLYRTFAPLKQSTQTMAIACVELSLRLRESDLRLVNGEHGLDYMEWRTSRAEVMGESQDICSAWPSARSLLTILQETMLDLLDLYTHHRALTIVGPSYPLDTFIAIRITLNQEASAADLPRFTNTDLPAGKEREDEPATNGRSSYWKKNLETNGTSSSKSLASPAGNESPPPTGPISATGTRGRVGERGRDGTVRFMLNAERALDEKRTVATYFRVDEEEVVVDADTGAEISRRPR